ncbi:unnamed protein product [Rhodiola kirilowii]
MVRVAAKEELMARWCTGHQLPNPTWLKHDLYCASQRSNWQLLLLRISRTPQNSWSIWRYQNLQPSMHPNSFPSTCWTLHCPHRRPVLTQSLHFEKVVGKEGNTSKT